jgi:hypothetical protein
MSLFENYISKVKNNVSSLKTEEIIPWVSGLSAPFNLAVYDGNFYVSNYDVSGSGNQISKILPDKSLIINWGYPESAGLYTGLLIIGTILYVASHNDGNILSIDLSTADPTFNNYTSFSTFTSGFSYPLGLATYGNYMYVANYETGYISKVSLVDPIGIGGKIVDWKTGFDGPFELLIHGSYMYVSNIGGVEDNGTTISRINLDTGDVNYSWATGLFAPSGLVVYESYLYVSSFYYGNIYKISLTDGSIIDPVWANGLYGPTSITIYNSIFYVTNYLGGSVSQIIYVPPVPPIPVSDICFPANTPVITDQGIIAIDKIDIEKHTIRGKPIVDITKTITNDKYLICFDPHALGFRCPARKTVMSRNHKVFYKGNFLDFPIK